MDSEDFETQELTSSESTSIEQRQNLLQQKQLEAQTIQHSLSAYIEELCEEYEVDVSRVVSMKNGKLLLEPKDSSESSE